MHKDRLFINNKKSASKKIKYTSVHCIKISKKKLKYNIRRRKSSAQYIRNDFPVPASLKAFLILSFLKQNQSRRTRQFLIFPKN